MGTSFVKFEENGFWTADSGVRVWLQLLVREVNKIPDTPEWLLAWRDSVHPYSVCGFCGVGCVADGLDMFVTTEERRLQLVSLCEQVLQQLEERGLTIEAVETALGRQPDLDIAKMTQGVRETGRAFNHLLHRHIGEYDKENPRNWKLNQVAPIDWYGGKVIS
jgi:hypothetical protein